MLYRLSTHLVCLVLTSSPLWAWTPTALIDQQLHRHHHHGSAAPHKQRLITSTTLRAAQMYDSEMANGYYDGGMDYDYPQNYYDSMDYGGDYNGGGGGYYDRPRLPRHSTYNQPRTSSPSENDHETIGPVRKSHTQSFWGGSNDNRRQGGGSHETLGPQPYYDSSVRKSRAQSFWTTGSERRDEARRNDMYNPRTPSARYDNTNSGAGGALNGYHVYGEGRNEPQYGRRNDYGGNSFGGGYDYNRRNNNNNNNWSPLPPQYQNNNFDPMEYYNDYPPQYGGNDPRWNPRGGRGGQQRYPMSSRRSSSSSQYQSGVTSPISSEKFQDSINSHSHMGPMPAWERRKMEKKWRNEYDDDYYW